MRSKYFLIFFFLLLTQFADGQLYKLSGIIINDKKEPLPLASVEIKELKKGSVSKDDGSFEFFVERGKYDVVISMVGYKNKIVTVYINNVDIIESIEMEDVESSNLSEIILKVKSRDRAEEIIKNVVKNKGSVLDAIGAYSVNVYIKAQRLDSVMDKRKDDADTTGSESFDGMSLAEISLHLDRGSDNQIKEERFGVNKRGKTDNLFYLSTTEGDFYIYDNLVQAPPLSKIPFVSPISYSGLVAYRFKTLKIDRTVRPRVYTIAIRPRQLSNATVEGEIVIQDSTWNVLSTEFRLPPAHVPEYDYFEVKQEYMPVGDSARMISRQQFNYYTKTKKGRLYGETTDILVTK